MIKIRYAELPDGLHAHVERCGRHTLIHLAPGLSAPQRREALGRLIRTSRRGHGPRLRPPGVSLAVARDATGGTLRNGRARCAAIRLSRCSPGTGRPMIPAG